MKTVGKELLLFLPRDFLNFIKPFVGERFDYFFKSYNWKFWSLEDFTVKNEHLKTTGLINKSDIAFASNMEGQTLFFRNESGRLSSKIYQIDEDGEWGFYAMSITEFVNFEQTQKLIKEIKRVGFQNQDLSVISHCNGSVFRYAYELYSSQFDASYSIERNMRALEIFEELADAGHPLAAHELATHYYYEEKLDIDLVIKWREKAIDLGSIEDIFELVDFIIDEDLRQVEKAILLLKGLLSVSWHNKRASLKLSRIYMDGLGVEQDFQKGIHYAEMSANAGNYNATTDLAFCYFEGKGVEQDLRKAHELLVMADHKITENLGEGLYAKEIRMMAEQLNAI